MRLLLTTLILLSAMISAPLAQAAQHLSYETRVDIINKNALSPERLADALYARFALNLDTKALRMAARVNPAEPVYWYRLATASGSLVGTPFGESEALENAAFPGYWESLSASQRKRAERLLRERRSLLEFALAADPNYLPALYTYAVSKPTYEQRMAALDKTAAADTQNAKPYYLMALLRYDHLSNGRKWLAKEQAYQLSQQEWAPVVDLIRKGNARAAFRATHGRLPSMADVRVSTNDNPWPAAAAASIAQTMMNDLWSGGIAEAPGSFQFSPRARQLVRQTAWQAKVMAKQGKRAEALEMLQVMHSFGDKMAVSEPYRVISLTIGMAMRSMAFFAEKQILTTPADKPRRDLAEKQAAEWRKMLTGYLEHPTELITVKSIKTSPSEHLQYIDFAAEEQQVAEMAKKLGLMD
jgi:hypothetical protein